MQEHIRRAHPEHYISKLPATEESFNLMISTAPSERPQVQQHPGPSHLNQTRGMPHPYHRDDSSAPATPRNIEEYHGGSLFPAAAALAQLHNHKIEPNWDSEVVCIHASLPVQLTSPRIKLLICAGRTGTRTMKAAGFPGPRLSFHLYT